METVIGALILLLMRKFANFSPLLGLRYTQSSPDVVAAGAAVGDVAGDGKGGMVGVGCGVSVDAAVGGTGVSVGIAA